ncbi:MAG: tetratricopeptide repeat protein [Mucilaginibacter polytrichastri]|nr:tetratricopeptide repeat protein [Mucilaginibacter polytrichastri]
MSYANHALRFSKKIGYEYGIGESYRIRGVGFFYRYRVEEATRDYMHALRVFQKLDDRESQAKVYNNIGGLHNDNDYSQAIENYQKALSLVDEEKGNKKFIAGIYMNIGTIRMKQSNYEAALSDCMKSYKLFKEIGNQVLQAQSLCNLGAINYELKNFPLAEKYLQEARSIANSSDNFSTISIANNTLSSIYIAQNRFVEASEVINEGLKYAEAAENDKLKYDYTYSLYELESKRKNYPEALSYLRQVYKTDSLNYKNYISDKIGLLQTQFRQREKERQDQLIIERQKNDRVLFWASSLVACLLLVLVFLMIRNVRRTQQSNKELTRLNTEIIFQKEELDRINRHLEEMIDERTREIQIKNKKLEGYSLHLSHQIRGPVSTLKGLMILEQENMIDKLECFEKMRKCIYDIDDRILNLNQALEDQSNMLVEVNTTTTTHFHDNIYRRGE